MNEAANLPWVFDRLDPSYEIVFVDGGSEDGTLDLAKMLCPDLVVADAASPGKGAALAAGMLAASGDIVVMIDADGSMDPAEIPAYVGLICAGADVVKGSRQLPGAGSEDLTLLRSLGNRALTLLANILYRQRWSELCYGYAAFSHDILHELDIAGVATGSDPGPFPSRFVDWFGGRRQVRYGHGFEIEALLFTRATRAGLRVVEVPTFERERLHGTSNLATFRDGARVLSSLLWERRPTVWRHRRHFRFAKRPPIQKDR